MDQPDNGFVEVNEIKDILSFLKSVSPSASTTMLIDSN